MSTFTGSVVRPLSRRTFLVASTGALTGLSFGSGPVHAARTVQAKGAATAKSTILFFLTGGASHVDLWDMKPKAPSGYRGPFQPIETSTPGIRLCEHLPLLAQQAHHLAVVNSVGGTVNTNDHHAGYYYNLTGHAPDQSFLALGNNRTPLGDDWPFMGSVVTAKRPAHPSMPSLITLPQKVGFPANTRPGQFAARLGLEYDPLYVEGSREEPLKFQSPALVLEGSPDKLDDRHLLLRELDRARRELDQHSEAQLWNRQQNRAFSLLLASQTNAAFDVTTEPVKVRERYGQNVNGMSLLLARRLVEAEVPFITVFWKGNPEASEVNKCASAGGWDTHSNNFECLKRVLLPEFDQCISALLEDLANRGLLDTTMVLVSSEMGRTPKIDERRNGGRVGSGRDHWTHCLTNLFAGGGIRGGQIYGSSDRLGAYPSDRPVTPAHIAKTVYHAMGVHDLQATNNQGRPYNLLDEGEPILQLF